MDKFKTDTIYMKIIDFCDEPRRAIEIEKHIGLSRSTTGHRIINLVDNGYIRIVKRFDNSNRGWKYQTIKHKQYSGVVRPQGMCILGVWI